MPSTTCAFLQVFGLYGLLGGRLVTLLLCQTDSMKLGGQCSGHLVKEEVIMLKDYRGSRHAFLFFSFPWMCALPFHKVGMSGKHQQIP